MEKLVFEMIDHVNGKKWEFFKHDDGLYSVKYYEFLKSAGWKHVFTEDRYDRNAIEEDYGVSIPA